MSIVESDRARHRVLLLSVVLAVIIGFGVGGAYLVGLAQRVPVADALTSGNIPADPSGDGVAASGPTDAELVQISQTASVAALSADIDSLLTRHFQAINTGDYAAYAATVTKPLSEADFRLAYATTSDTDGLVHQIATDDAGSAQVTLSFISQQSIESAPPDLPSDCIGWTVVWTIDGPAADLTVGASDSSQTQQEPCSSQ